MALSELPLRYQYRPNDSNLVDDFYVPCLSHSCLYQRAVGYFTSGSLALAARGLSEFVASGAGRMQLIASPMLAEEDREAINLGYEARTDVVARCLLRHLHAGEDAIVRQRLGFLAWLVANNRLDLKIAMVADIQRHGIYHEKIGIFHDGNGNKVAFTGSSNETVGGLYSNFETIEAFCSWREGDAVRVENKCRDFFELWENSTAGLEVLEFPEAVRRGLLDYARYYEPGVGDPECHLPAGSLALMNTLAVPAALGLRDYQKAAVREWFRHGGSGILEMATGTGKTVTALTTAVKLYERLGRLGLVIVAPYTHLVDQWQQEARQFGFRPIVAYKSRHLWENDVVGVLTAFQVGACDHYCIITTMATLLSDAMQSALIKVSQPAMLIADEAHHLGAPQLREKLPAAVRYRLALSATPERWHDDDGSDALKAYFSPGVIFTYGLKEAIEAGFLTHYMYYPHVVELTEGENDEYLAITRQIVKLVAGKDESTVDQDRLQNLLIARARVVSRAENKLSLLRELVRPRKHEQHNLFYCGDATVDGDRQVDIVTRLLGKELGMRVHPFTSEESPTERQRLLKEFEEGKLQALIAIRCLDEGVDIPATQTAYILASSTNPREFIQRRGRILRRHPAKQLATIHDFIVSPRDLAEVRSLDPEMFNLERKLVRKELTRVTEFAGLADNAPQANRVLLDLKKTYHLLDM